ncbi:hypothetical protein T10_8532 [Trichinella papuae]|uniref:Uncharacterized protein n=1 Tax=Trichinella papuae TaxID=268474 RepID=A0A0V1MD61_9BILA|nr:hypothetical protein T10_8532 [Trichinella papuae]
MKKLNNNNSIKSKSVINRSPYRRQNGHSLQMHKTGFATNPIPPIRKCYYKQYSNFLYNVLCKYGVALVEISFFT